MIPRPINSRNTITRKGRLAVVFLGSTFPKALKMHCQVKSLLTEPLCLLTLRLFDIFIPNNTHRLLVASTTSCRYRDQNNGRPERSKSVQNEGLTGQTSNVAFMFTFKIRKKIETFIQIIALLDGEKLSEVEGSPSQPSQLYRVSVQQKNVAPFDRVDGWPSQSWIHTDFNIPSSIQ